MSSSEHDYDFIDVDQDSSYDGSSAEDTVTSSLAPPRGWSTLSLSDADTPKTAGPVVAGSAACVRREFISAAPAPTSTRFESAAKHSSAAALECSVCDRLLRDCVECPACHGLFCREHLRVERNGKSRCPCEPCCSFFSTLAADSIEENGSDAAATNPIRHLHPTEAFLPNIPVQRMADAVPSSCDGCGISLSWGELGLHFCDQQLVPCEYCGWRGKRHIQDLHASTSCRAKELVARARHETLEARAELNAARRDGEEAKRRASTAEMRASELEARLQEVEVALRQRIAETAAIKAKAVVARMKEDELQRLLRESRAEGAAVVGKVPPNVAGRARSSAPPGAAAVAVATPGAAGTSSLGFAAMLNRAGFAPAAAAAAPVAAEPAAAVEREATTAAAAVSREKGSPKGALQAAVQMAKGAAGGVTTDSACQAPVPSVEACLKPYLDKPESLLKKKVVVFWPRQGSWYVGRPTSYNEATKEHHIEYDDGDVRDHVLAHRSWGVIG